MMHKIKTAKKAGLHTLKTAVLVLAALLLAATPLTEAYADSYDEQIRALERNIAGYQNEASRLRAEADTLQNKVNSINAEKSRLQAQIDLNTAKIEQLGAKIVETQQKIEDQKKLLGNNLVALYLDNSVSPLEMLASSKNISEYIDKQEYRDTIRSGLQDSIAKVKDLEKDLNQQKKETEFALADQKGQRDELAARENEQALLLAQTQGQEAAYQAMTAQTNQQVKNLREEQRRANLQWGGNVAFGPACGGGYSGPYNWCNAPLDAYVDNWGMYTRECVSYAAFKVWASGRNMPYWGGRGNANQWDENAYNDGIPIDSNPRAGDIAVSNAGYYGHVMYVEAVRPNGDIYISEYNFDWTGRYSERTITRGTWQSQGFKFIHF